MAAEAVAGIRLAISDGLASSSGVHSAVQVRGSVRRDRSDQDQSSREPEWHVQVWPVTGEGSWNVFTVHFFILVWELLLLLRKDKERMWGEGSDRSLAALQDLFPMQWEVNNTNTHTHKQKTPTNKVLTNFVVTSKCEL